MVAKTLFKYSSGMLVGDADAQLVAGDLAAYFDDHKGRVSMVFEDTNEMAATTPELQLTDYDGGTVVADIDFYMASDATNDIAIDVFVESKTVNSDTLDLEAATSWDTANSGTLTVGSTTAGDPLRLTITLANKDSMANLDLIRFGVRRDTDSANDDATGNLYISSLTIRET